MNIVAIMGRMAADPELKQTAGGVSVVSFTVAVERHLSKDKEKITDWIDCVAWRGTAEFICKYFQKGSPIVVEGTIQTRNWEDREGNKRKTVEVNAESIEFVPRSSSERSEQKESKVTLPEVKEVYTAPQSFSQGASEDFEQVQLSDEDLPF